MVEFIIGEPKKVQLPAIIFKINVQYMHGDADAYSDNSFFFSIKNTNDLKRTILALNFVKTGPYTDLYDYDKARMAIREFFENHGWTNDDAESFIDNYIIGDITNDSRNDALIKNYNVYYYDEDSLECDVKIKIDERPL